MEYYEDCWMEKADIEREIDATTRGDTSILRNRLKSLYDILEIPGGYQVQFDDPLIAKWEKEIAEGKDPDLTEGMPDNG